MIGIFDSGSGGLSVLRELRAHAPDADVVYFGDLKNAPYGNKAREELGALTVLGIEKLIQEGVTEIVSACNSVSVSIALPMFDILGIPRANIIEMVGPTVSSFRGSEARVLVVATKATIDSHVYQDGFRVLGVGAHGIALPELASLIETNAGDDAYKHIIRLALLPFQGTDLTHIVLGCTHFPLVAHVFTEVIEELGMKAELVDPAVVVVDHVINQFTVTGSGTTKIIVSNESAVFDQYVQKVLH